MTLCLSPMHAAGAEHIVGAVEVVFSADAIDAAYEHLQRRGVRFHQAPRQATERAWAASFRDPDGHELSMLGPTDRLGVSGPLLLGYGFTSAPVPLSRRVSGGSASRLLAAWERVSVRAVA